MLCYVAAHEPMLRWCDAINAYVVVQIHPGLFASAAPWQSGAAYKEVLSTYSNAAVACTYVRDTSSGQVKIDRDGRPRLHYKISKEDAGNIWKVRPRSVQ